MCAITLSSRCRQFRNELKTCLLAAAAVLFANPEVLADQAMSADPDGPAAFLLGPGRTAGWKFKVNLPIEVTHLGLYDWQANGFQLSYPVGMWNEGGSLIASTTIASGTGSPYLDGFRYQAVQGLPPILTPGQIYTVGYFASGVAPNDHMLHLNGSHDLNKLLEQVGGGYVSSGAGQLMMPDASFQGFEQWIGPGFLFNVVPGPGAFALVAMAGTMVRPARRRGQSRQARRSLRPASV